MNVISGVVQGVAAPLFDLVDNLFTSDEERAEAKRKLIQMEQRGELDGMKVQLSAILAEAQSEDPWTSRARPTFLYVIYTMLITMLIFSVVGGILSVWFDVEVQIAAAAMKDLMNATFGTVPEWLYGLFGAGYLGYTGARSLVDKKHRAGK